MIGRGVKGSVGGGTYANEPGNPARLFFKEQRRDFTNELNAEASQ
jgi:hypothetical protein